jgi:hypothetical protein
MYTAQFLARTAIRPINQGRSGSLTAIRPINQGRSGSLDRWIADQSIKVVPDRCASRTNQSRSFRIVNQSRSFRIALSIKVVPDRWIAIKVVPDRSGSSWQAELHRGRPWDSPP